MKLYIYTLKWQLQFAELCHALTFSFFPFLYPPPTLQAADGAEGNDLNEEEAAQESAVVEEETGEEAPEAGGEEEEAQEDAAPEEAAQEQTPPEPQPELTMAQVGRSVFAHQTFVRS